MPFPIQTFSTGANKTQSSKTAVHFGTSRFALSGARGTGRDSRHAYLARSCRDPRVSPATRPHVHGDEDVPSTTASSFSGTNFWQRNFGGDPNVLGKQIVLSNRSRTVSGVMPRGFSFRRSRNSGCRSPDAADVHAHRSRSTRHRRLKDGVTFAQRRLRWTTSRRVSNKRIPSRMKVSGVKIIESARTLRRVSRGAVDPTRRRRLRVAGGLRERRQPDAGARDARQKEFALRAALGASRWRIVRQLLIESCCCALRAVHSVSRFRSGRCTCC
jgi:putative ABC transport system permease protein